MYYIRQPEAKRNEPPEVKEVNETKTSNLSSEEISVLGVVLRVTSIATRANNTEKVCVVPNTLDAFHTFSH